MRCDSFSLPSFSMVGGRQSIVQSSRLPNSKDSADPVVCLQSRSLEQPELRGKRAYQTAWGRATILFQIEISARSMVDWEIRAIVENWLITR
jgi:hypothetical protein